MYGKFVTGAIFGAAVGIMMLPEMDRGTKRRIKRTTKHMRHFAEDAYDGIRGKMK